MKIRLLNLLLVGSIVSSVMFSSCNKDKKVHCKITKPQENDTVRVGTTVTIIAESDYEKGIIAETRFFIDGLGMGSSTEFPYEYDWDTDTVSSGWHTIKAEAKADDGASNTDEKQILLIGDVTRALAGNDTIIDDGSTSLTLFANEPEFDYEISYWEIVSGTGGNFADSTKANTVFTGKINTMYELRWTISNMYDSDHDDITVIFRKIEYGSVTDIDGNTYKTVTIGNQVWMAENLKVTHFPNGNTIPLITGNTDWDNLYYTDKAYCYYNNSTTNKNTYGALYTYAAAKEACPDGWHLPTDSEWSELEDHITYSGFSNQEGYALKSISGWNYGGNGIDFYGFSALPGGKRNDYYGSFENLGSDGRWWSSTTYNSSRAYYRYLYYSNHYVNRTYDYMNNGFSVRCIKD